MPYIKQEDRVKLDFTIDSLTALLKTNPNYEGNLNYCLGRLINSLLKNNLRYAEVNRIIGALECAKLEVYRRLVSPYEDLKAIENGDVFTVVE
jgi:hypothetical protein|tara:strand:+ start:2418 stop:2696 length:279 start_codon:yes stop_codon:yes gene_type:complete